MSASTPRSAFRDVSPKLGTSHVNASARMTAKPPRISGATPDLTGRGSRVRETTRRSRSPSTSARTASAAAAPGSLCALTASTSACPVTSATATEQRRHRADHQQPWHEQDPHLHDQRLDERQAGAEQHEDDRQQRELLPHRL